MSRTSFTTKRRTLEPWASHSFPACSCSPACLRIDADERILVLRMREDRLERHAASARRQERGRALVGVPGGEELRVQRRAPPEELAGDLRGLRQDLLENYLKDPMDGASPAGIARALAHLSTVRLRGKNQCSID